MSLPIPDPERPLSFDHALKGHVEEQTNTFRPGGLEINPERHDALRFTDAETGQIHQIMDIEPDPEDPDQVLGVLVSIEETESEPKRVRASRVIHESKPYKFLFVDHKTATEVTTAVISISAVAVASLVVRHRKKQ